MVKNFISLSLIVLLQVIGNGLLRYGMQSIGSLDLHNPSTIVAWLLNTVTSPYVLLGVILLIVWFVVFLGALSWLDLSYVLPMSSSTYILSALVAWLVLGESVSKGTWIGTLIVSVGVLLVGQSERKQGQEAAASVGLSNSEGVSR
jgi:transporter family protein